MRYIKRLRGGNTRVTKDKIYIMAGERISDDNGDHMRPAMRRDDWWKEVHHSEYAHQERCLSDDRIIDPPTQEMDRAQRHHPDGFTSKMDKAKRYIVERMGPSNTRSTYGKQYEVEWSPRTFRGRDEGRWVIAKNDLGTNLVPSLKNPRYWKVVREAAEKCWNDELIAAEFTAEPTEEPPMSSLVIKKGTLIDGTDSDQYDDDAIIANINLENSRADKLREVKAESKSITARIAEHDANVVLLAELLDARMDAK